MKKESENSGESALMHYRQIMLEDGRYMIFYTFAEELSKVSQSNINTSNSPEPGSEKEDV